LGSGEFNHLRPFLGFRLHKYSEFSRAEYQWRCAEFRESRPHFLISQRGVERIVEPVDDVRGRVLRRRDPPPAACLETGTKSLMDGTSGSAGDRGAVVTASARSLPSRMYSMPWGMVSNITWTCPLSRSISAGAPPR